jgi:hypothetical protein
LLRRKRVGRTWHASAGRQVSGRLMSINAEMLVLKVWKQTTQFSGGEDWMFASPVQLGGLPWSYPHVGRVFQKAAFPRILFCHHPGIPDIGPT